MKKTLLIFTLACYYLTSISQTAPNKYWIQFTDKNNNGYSVDTPEEFLSAKAIDRRQKQRISITAEDLPITQSYINELQSLGLTIVNRSKWFNAVTVYTTDYTLIENITDLPFVKSQLKVQKFTGNYEQPVNLKSTKTEFERESLLTIYGVASAQISMHNGQTLHNSGFKGEGMIIAILDGGFMAVDQHSAFDSLFINNKLLGTKDFVDGNDDVYESSDHGSKVLSIMAGNEEGQFVGVAPNASYWLLRTEYGPTEYIVEEDNWVSAAEFADSAGVDVINTSLGYTEFDDPSQNHTYADLNGKTTRISIAADMAISKGMIVVTSAGNSGDDPWLYVSPPADAENIISVGAVDYAGNYVLFSSIGPTADGRIKPEVAAIGYQTMAVNIAGGYEYSYGTSFAAPVICGLTACLWQRFPNKSNHAIRQLILNSGCQSNSPDNYLGYGIPDFASAANLTDIQDINLNQQVKIFPNPFTNNLSIDLGDINQEVQIEIFDILGKQIYKRRINPSGGLIQLSGVSNMESGIYIIRVLSGTNSLSYKLVKN